MDMDDVRRLLEDPEEVPSDHIGPNPDLDAFNEYVDQIDDGIKKLVGFFTRKLPSESTDPRELLDLGQRFLSHAQRLKKFAANKPTWRGLN